MAERRGFTGRAYGHDAADPVLNLELDKLFKCRFIEAVISEWRNQRRVGSFKHGKRVVTGISEEKQIFFAGVTGGGRRAWSKPRLSIVQKREFDLTVE